MALFIPQQMRRAMKARKLGTNRLGARVTHFLHLEPPPHQKFHMDGQRSPVDPEKPSKPTKIQRKKPPRPEVYSYNLHSRVKDNRERIAQREGLVVAGYCNNKERTDSGDKEVFIMERIGRQARRPSANSSRPSESHICEGAFWPSDEECIKGICSTNKSPHFLHVQQEISPQFLHVHQETRGEVVDTSRDEDRWSLGKRGSRSRGQQSDLDSSRTRSPLLDQIQVSRCKMFFLKLEVIKFIIVEFIVVEVAAVELFVVVFVSCYESWLFVGNFQFKFDIN